MWEKLLRVEGLEEEGWIDNLECRHGWQAELAGRHVGCEGCSKKELCLQIAAFLWHEQNCLLVCLKDECSVVAKTSDDGHVSIHQNTACWRGQEWVNWKE